MALLSIYHQNALNGYLLLSIREWQAWHKVPYCSFGCHRLQSLVIVSLETVRALYMQLGFHMDLLNATQPNLLHMLYYNISIINMMMKNVVFRSDYEFIKDITYLTLMGQLYFVNILEKITYMEVHLNGLVQEIRNSSALVMELHLSCTNPSICTTLNLEQILLLVIDNIFICIFTIFVKCLHSDESVHMSSD